MEAVKSWISELGIERVHPQKVGEVVPVLFVQVISPNVFTHLSDTESDDCTNDVDEVHFTQEDGVAVFEFNRPVKATDDCDTGLFEFVGTSFSIHTRNTSL